MTALEVKFSDAMSSMERTCRALSASTRSAMVGSTSRKRLFPGSCGRFDVCAVLPVVMPWAETMNLAS
eukprot:CAMPEP_0195048520 /NCGR_PEP_ID=MMETSP0347-20130606/47193_1 /TAXON_ID=2932 /ORGANISM="Alexandrium fundyense, Strain CCMP1719" /LENGTH=67 /DNA_ID=CAMNT_0040077015 /DNA_START=62 /DNA_END=261 /DNA_ORIENTATION=-